MRQGKPNFDRCQRILQLFSKHGSSISHQDIHKFVARFDRASLRTQTHFKPLQQMLQILTPKLLSDKFIAKTPHLLSNTTSIYASLNVYSTLWMGYCNQIVFRWFKQGETVTIEQLYQIYRAFVQLNDDKHQEIVQLLRINIKIKMLNQINTLISKQSESQQLSKQFEMTHKYIRAMLLDKQTPSSFFYQIFQAFQNLLQTMQKTKPFKISSYHYNNCTICYQFCTIFNIPIQPNRYRQLLKGMHERILLNYDSKKYNSQISQRAGQSAFENRFQKALYINGYDYEGNVRIGLIEFDVLVKGRKFRKFYPFEGIDLQSLKQGKFKQISEDQLQVFQKMTGCWHINQQEKLKQQIVINLNGPYHYIVGDKDGVVRTENIKEEILKCHGYKRFQQVDYREWQAKTKNKRDVARFLQSIIQ